MELHNIVVSLERNTRSSYSSMSVKSGHDAQVDTSAGASAGTPKDSCPAQLISNIMVRANGRDVIKNIDFETLHRLTQMRHGTRPRIDSLPAGYAELSNQAVDVHAMIDFAMWNAVKPVDTLFDHGLHSRGQLLPVQRRSLNPRTVCDIPDKIALLLHHPQQLDGEQGMALGAVKQGGPESLP